MFTLPTQDFNDTDEVDLDKAYYLLGNRFGVYQAQTFVEQYNHLLTGKNIPDDYLQALQIGPEHDLYFEAWERILNDRFTFNGQQCYLYQTENGDLYAVPFA